LLRTATPSSSTMLSTGAGQQASPR
jgi:hypothetical protein